MKQTYDAKAASFQNKSHRRRNWRRIFLGMAMVVVFVTTYMLILPAITMENDLVCGLEEHIHGNSCYTTQLVCALDAGEESGHIHGEGCYEQQENLTCGRAEGAHVHGEGCCAVTRTLVCGDPAHGGHSHGEGCYEEQEVLLCPLEETEGHLHDEEGCYGQVQDIICELAEVSAHSHGTDCWGLERVLVCELPLCGDSHTESCWAEAEELTCGLTGEDVHTHGESCVTMEDILVCDDSGGTIREVSAGEEHFHGTDCYHRELTCQLSEHTHDDACKGSPEEEAPLLTLPQGAEIPAGCDKEYTFTDEAGRFQAAVYAPADALPRGAELRVSLLAQDSPDYIAAARALTEEYAGLLALDIRFELDGAEVEPASPIYVCINALGLLPRDADPASITVEHHLETQPTAVEVVAGGEDGVEAMEEGGLTAAFGVDHLSIFTVRWNSVEADGLSPSQEGTDTLAQGLVFHLFDYDPLLVSGETLPVDSILGEDGWPVLSGEEGQSLAGLFDPQTRTEGKTSYPNANFLLREEEGHYFFDSAETFARLADIPQDYTLADGGVIPSYSFSLYDQTEGGAFLPFNGSGQEEENLAFGMTMTATVTVPEEDVPMALELGSGDDLWLFLDDRLALDLSSGNTAGVVSLSGETSVTTGEGSLTLGPGQVWTEENGVQDLWPLLGLEEPWAAGSTHSLSLFYLNRGESRPTLRMNLNLPESGEEPIIFLPDFTANLPLSLKLQGAEQVVGTGEAWSFRFLMTQIDGPQGEEGMPGSSGSGEETVLAVGSLGSQTGLFTLFFHGNTPDGIYYYKIYQDDSQPREGVDYDQSYYIAEVEVADGSAGVLSLTHYVEGESRAAEEVAFTNVAAAEGTLTLKNVIERSDGNPQKPIACNEYALTFSTSVLDKDYRTYYAPYTNENLTEGGLVHDGGDGRLAFNVDRVKGTATAHVELHPGESVTITLPAGAEIEVINLWTMAFDVKWTGDTATGNEVAGDTVTTKPIGGDLELICINTTGFQLPETGGMGTTPLLVLGMLLTFGAGGLLLLMRRKGGAFSP